MSTFLSLAVPTHSVAIGLASCLILLGCSPAYLAQGKPSDEPAITKAVFAYHVAAQRRAEAGTAGPADFERKSATLTTS